LRPRSPLLAGNSQAAIDVLELMLELWRPDEILVIAPPHGPKHSWQPSLAERAGHEGVRVLAPQDVNDPAVIAELGQRRTDLLLSVYYTQIFSPALLDVVDGLRLNFHPSLLPRHRGTAPLIWAIAEGDEQTGVTVHELTRGVDTGPIWWQRPLGIHRDDTGYTLHLKAAKLVRSIAADLLRRLEQDRPLPEPIAQTGAVSVHTSRDPQLNRIDWTLPAVRIRNVVRALAHPLPGADTTWSGETVGIERVELSDARRASHRPGMVDVAADGEVVVSAGDGALRLVTIRRDGRLLPATTLTAIGLGTGEILG
jgi:UDP-4-amino-4-deoxy-L-arabinose formyltransferase/UDP-glucuronic acid dehydrogenase (UDP-4-keto-hexauronic acid decarboxylating)